MIVDPDSQHMATDNVIHDSPPTYDVATSAASVNGDVPKVNIDAKRLSGGTTLVSPAVAGSSYNIQPGYFQPITVHHYANPITGERVSSLLPPDDPEMICLQAGSHIPQTKYGILGILAAVFWFPLGIGLCLLDRRVKCERCGMVLNDGLCD